MKLFCVLIFAAFNTWAADKTVKLGDLPAAVQAAVKERTRNATLVGISTEKEEGKTMYEVETKVDGKSRDLLFDQSGTIVETEEEVDIETLPAPARAAFEKRAMGGTLAKVEKVMAGGTTTYEGTIKTKAGKTTEYAVTSAGKPKKD